MSIIVVSTPDKTINGIISNVNASKSQLPYIFNRKDYIQCTIIDNFGVLRIVIPADGVNPGIENEVKVGDTLYFGADQVSLIGRYIVTSIFVSGAVSEIRCNTAIPYTINGTGFVNNLSFKPSYKVEVQIWDSLNTTQLIPLTFRYATEESGKLFLNIGQILTNLMELTPANSMEYILRYREGWEGSNEAWNSTSVIQAIAAKKQIGLDGGSNLWEHLLRELEVYQGTGVQNNGADSGFIELVLNNDIDGNPLIGINVTSRFTIGQWVYVEFSHTYITDYYQVKGFRYASDLTRIGFDIPFTVNSVASLYVQGIGKFLTKFKEPFVWKGWNRSIGILQDRNLSNRTGVTLVKVRQQSYTINKTVISPNFFSPGLGSGSKIIEYKFDQNTISNFYQGVKVFNTDFTKIFSEEILYKILEPCINPVMVSWENSLGAPEQHLFSINQEVGLEASPGLSYITPHIIDQEQIRGDKNRVFSEDRQTFLLISEGLTNNQIKALAEIKISNNIFVYLSKDGSEKIKVIARDLLGSNYETRNRANNEFKLLVEFPDNYDFFEAKLY